MNVIKGYSALGLIKFINEKFTMGDIRKKDTKEKKESGGEGEC